jgi:hypothetical protein
MSSTWNLLELALTEASGKDTLLKHIRRTQGDYEADQLAPFLDSMWNAQGLPGLAKHLVQRYSDPTVNSIFDKELAKFGPKAKAEPKAKKKAEPVGPQFKDPAQVKATSAAADALKATRPDATTRVDPSTKGPMPAHGKKVEPGTPVQHDVGQSVRGTSPGHTRPPQEQPSQASNPSQLARQLKPLQDTERQLQKQITVNLQNDPTKKPQLAKAKEDLKAVQQQIAQIKNVGSSGVEGAQKRVDDLSKAYGKTAPHISDDLARKLGVPTTKQRTRRSIDRETGEEKLVVQVWNQDKVYQFMNKGAASQSGNLRIDPELEPGVYDPTPGQAGQKTPVTDIGKGKAATQKPMMKAPKGMDKAGLAQLSTLRMQYSKLKKTGGDQSQMAQLKSQIDQLMSSGPAVDVVRPGTKVGMRWGDVVWDGLDWALDSQAAARAGDAAGTD